MTGIEAPDSIPVLVSLGISHRIRNSGRTAAQRRSAFPVPIVRKMRVAGVVVDANPRWASTTREWSTEADSDHVPAQDRPAARSSA